MLVFVDSIILTEWIELEKDLWENNTIVSPNRFVSKVQSVAREKNIELFTGWAQNDISEFLLLMIECIHNSISRPVRIDTKLEWFGLSATPLESSKFRL